MAVEVHVYVDVADLERGIDFYARGLGLGLGRRLDASWAEMVGAPAPIHILEKPARSPACSGTGQPRDYARHWTPVHLDFVVRALDAAVERACAAGATLDREIQERQWEGQRARLANPPIRSATGSA